MGSALSRVVFPAPEATYAWDPHWIWLNTSSHEVIPAFFIDKGAKYTLIFSHGNAEDLGSVIEKMREVSHILDVNVFAYEYTGYGMSTGVASEQAFYADIHAAYSYLKDVIGVPWQRIVPYGWSIGSGPSVHLATQRPVRALVLQSPLLSVYRVAMHTRVTLPGDMFRNRDRMGDVACPTFVIHGTKDETIPFWHAEDLVLQCRAECYYPPLFVKDGGHCDLDKTARDDFYHYLLKFLQWLDKADCPVGLLELAEQRGL
uniref:Serine aminopeptidase S33 domain-containing protein n=1 Tax=Zooxanthella nutricula TaxID=1333877 RepID=A0A7S2MJ18_9DINO|mmetsp:Transcript_101851/g.311510  ORF Transcript_101851/g.311510 Transcript_101851/m.311510 type:complete len:259 (+) Transcript_101851:41-817(+)